LQRRYARIASISSRRTAAQVPVHAPPLTNHGNYIISLNKFVKWLAGLVEEEGVDLFTGFAGVEILMDGQRILGVRTVTAASASTTSGRRASSPASTFTPR
jgi:flavin-dependent dehydrogenase